MRHRWGLYSSRVANSLSATFRRSAVGLQELVPVSITSLKVFVSIHGLITDVTCHASYTNDEAYDADCVFLFAMERDSAMYRFEAVINGRKIVGQCFPKTEQEDDQQTASARHVRFDESTADMFSCGIGCLSSGDTVTILFQYSAELPVDDGGSAHFLFPTFVPRAYQKNFAGALDEIHGMNASFSCGFEGVILGSYLIGEIYCKELMQVEYLDGSQYQAKIALLNGHDISSDLEFTIMYKDIHLPHMLVESPIDFTTSDYYVLQNPVAVFSFYSRVRKAMSSSTKGEYIIAIDRSGSMRGLKMQNARETLLYFLKSLPHGCYFNVISFGTTFQPLFPRSRIYNQHNVRQAFRLQMKMGADLLGTEMLPMLKYLHELPALDHHRRQIFLLTDGAVTNTREVLDYAWEQSARSTRMFTFGIGESASRPLLLGLARAGNGQCQFMKANERPYSKVLAALRSAMQPCLTDVELRFKAPTGVEICAMAPGLPATIFAEEKLTVYCLVSGKPFNESVSDCTATLCGKLEEEDYSCTVHFDLKKPLKNDNQPVHRLAVKSAILNLEKGIRNALGAEDIIENEHEILVASEACNIASVFTHHIGMDWSTGELIKMDEVVPSWPEERALKLSSSGVDLHFPETGSVYKSRSRLSLPRTESGFRSFVKSIFPANSSVWSLQGQGRQQNSSHRERPTLADIDEELAVSQVDLNCNSTDEWSKFKAVLGKPLGITQFQQTDGSWPLSREVAYALGSSAHVLRSSNPLRSETTWTTTLCLVWLRTHFAALAASWKEHEKKALAWLANAELEGYAIDELFEMAESVVSHECKLEGHVGVTMGSQAEQPSSLPDTSKQEWRQSRSSGSRGSKSLGNVDAGSSCDDLESLDDMSNMYDAESLYRYEIFNLMETYSDKLKHKLTVSPAASQQAALTSTAVITNGLNESRAASAKSIHVPEAYDKRATARTVAVRKDWQPASNGRNAVSTDVTDSVARQTDSSNRAKREVKSNSQQSVETSHASNVSRGHERQSFTSTSLSYRSAQDNSTMSWFSNEGDSRQKQSKLNIVPLCPPDTLSLSSGTGSKRGWRMRLSALFARLRKRSAEPTSNPGPIAAIQAATQSSKSSLTNAHLQGHDPAAVSHATSSSCAHTKTGNHSVGRESTSV